jgi:hypothetical protein
MAITGNLETMQFAELLQWLGQGRKTGTLVIDGGEVEKRIHFRAGRIVSTSSTDPRDYLGQYLVRQGHLTETELNAAVRQQEPEGMLLGRLLLASGKISEEALQPLLAARTRETICEIFTWREADFHFLDGQLPEKSFVPADLDVTGVVLEGVRRLDEWQRIGEVIPTLDAVPVAMGPLADPALTAEEQRVLAAIDDRSTLAEIRDRSHTSDFTACETVFRAVQGGRVKVVVPRWAGGAGEAPTGEGPAATADPEVTGDSLAARAKAHLEGGRHEEALRHLRAARALAPDDRRIARLAEEGEERIRRILEAAGVVSTAVPRMNQSLEELTASKLSRQEGFLLSRITGTYDIAAILKISSIPSLDALLTFYRLVEAGYVKLDPPAHPRR